MVYTVLIADECFGSRDEAERILKGYNMQAVFCERDGAEVVSAVDRLEPDAVVMNVSMRGFDGYGVLSLMKERVKAPDFIVTYSGTDSGIAEKAISSGASYCIELPIDRHLLASKLDVMRVRKEMRLRDDLPARRKRDAEAEITEMLNKLSVPANVKGYQYLREAISMTLRDTDLLNSVTKALYPMVAKRFGTTPSRAERAIRHAIEAAWDRGRSEEVDAFFGYTVRADRGKPTNSEFIALVSDRLRLGVM